MIIHKNHPLKRIGHHQVRALTVTLLFALKPSSANAQQEAFDRAVAGAAETLASRLSGKTVAVFEFPDLEGRVSNLSRLVSEEMTTGLVQYLTGGGTVVERRQVLQVMAELRLQRTDLTANEVSRVGRQLGADAIVLGSTAVLGQQIVLNVRAVDVERGQVLAAARASVRGTGQLIEMARQGYGGPNLAARPTSNSSASVPPPPPQSSRVSQPAPDRTASQRIGSVSLDLQQCVQTGDAIRCEFMVTSSRNAPFTIVRMGFPSDQLLGRNRLVDSRGSEYQATAIGIGGEPREYGDAGTTLIAAVPTRAAVVFSGVEESERIPLLEIQVFSGEAFHAVRFRDVPIRK